jgi:hypothetical protein
MTFDQEQSSRLGQRLPVENPGIRIVTFATLPEVAYKGQIVYLTDLDYILIYDGTAWQPVGDGASGSGSRIFVSATDPSLATTVSDGDEWYNTSTQTLKLRHSGSWVDPKLVTGQADGITITGAVLQTAASGNRVKIQDASGSGQVLFYSGIGTETHTAQIVNDVISGEAFLHISPTATTANPDFPIITLQAGNEPTTIKSVGIDGVLGGPEARFQRLRCTTDVFTAEAQPWAYRWRTGTQSIPNSNVTGVVFGSGSGGDVDITTTDDEVYHVHTTGTYSIVASVGWNDSSTSGRRQIAIYTNGAVHSRYAVDASTTASTNFATPIHGILKMSSGDTFTIKAFQNSGGSLNVLGDKELTHMTVYMMG